MKIPDFVPLAEDDQGGLRVGGTRVTLESVAASWRDGATPEQIVDQFPTLAPGDVYAVVAWMLRHPDDAAQYFARRQAQADANRRLADERSPSLGFKAMLEARIVRC